MNRDEIVRIPSVNHEAQEQLKQLAVPVARWLASHGFYHSEVRICTASVFVHSYEYGQAFTPEEEVRIFQNTDSPS